MIAIEHALLTSCLPWWVDCTRVFCSTFNRVGCVCGADLGRVYQTTTRKFDHIREFVTFSNQNITSYALGTGGVANDIDFLPQIGLRKQAEEIRKIEYMIVRHSEMLDQLQQAVQQVQQVQQQQQASSKGTARQRRGGSTSGSSAKRRSASGVSSTSSSSTTLSIPAQVRAVQKRPK
eukprot:m.36137 g.36137  ORF g.36137 m.36137 type:complete len:177 (-) comp9968_c0_seq1:1418-1948(-)